MSSLLGRLVEVAAVVVAKTAIDHLLRYVDGDDVSAPRVLYHFPPDWQSRAHRARQRARDEAERKFGVKS